RSPRRDRAYRRRRRCCARRAATSRAPPVRVPRGGTTGARPKARGGRRCRLPRAPPVRSRRGAARGRVASHWRARRGRRGRGSDPFFNSSRRIEIFLLIPDEVPAIKWQPADSGRQNMAGTSPPLDGWRRSARTLKRVAPYLWPEGEGWVKRRVVLSLLALLTAKIVSVATPFLYKAAVDSLTGEARADTFLLALGAVALTVAYGVARVGSIGFNELRDVVFVRVGQRALRKLALETFTHIHRLSMRYHITRKTGGLSRIIERGVKGVEFLLRFMLLSVGPLILELTMVTVIFALAFDWRYAAVV